MHQDLGTCKEGAGSPDKTEGVRKSEKGKRKGNNAKPETLAKDKEQRVRAFEKFKARIDEERKRELALLALQKNVSVRARHAKLRCIFRWIQDSQYANQSDKETNCQYVVKSPKQPNKFIKNYRFENPEREKEPEANKMVTLVKPKLKSQFPQETDNEQRIVNRNGRKIIESYETRLKMLEDAALKHEVKLNEVCVAQKCLRKDLFTKQSGGSEKKAKAKKKKEGYSKEIKTNGTENIYENMDFLTAAKQNAMKEHTAANQAKAEEMTCSYNEKTRNTKRNKIALTEKEKLQRHALKNLNQEVKERQEVYEENVGQIEEPGNKFRDVRRGDAKPAHLEQVAVGVNSERDFRFEMKEMEEKREQMRRTANLEKEVANLELQCKLNEHKIFRLEEHVGKLEDRIEKKDLFIEQLLYKKYKTSGIKGLLGCS